MMLTVEVAGATADVAEEVADAARGEAGAGGSGLHDFIGGGSDLHNLMDGVSTVAPHSRVRSSWDRSSSIMSPAASASRNLSAMV